MALESVQCPDGGCQGCPNRSGRLRAVPGEGPRPARVMFVGEAPGEEEEKRGRPLVGNAGRVFDRLLQRAGLDRAGVYITNLLKCRPPGNRAPRAAEIRSCLPLLLAEIEIVGPTWVVPMGAHACRALLGPRFRLTSKHGEPVQRDGRVYFPMFHPASMFYREELQAALENDIKRLSVLLHREGNKVGRPS